MVVRRLYGVAGGAHQDFSRFCFRIAWPSAEWGSLPIEGGVDAAYRREIDAAPDPAARRKEIEQRLIALRSPFSAAEAFAVEDIVDPRDTRPMLAEWLANRLRAAATVAGGHPHAARDAPVAPVSAGGPWPAAIRGHLRRLTG